jgi:hypothetical protein
MYWNWRYSDSEVRHECKQVGGFFPPVIARNCTKDEGADLQEKASNRLKLLWPKAMVVSI